MNQLPGGGPWRILPGCPAALHNSERAATRSSNGRKCECPRGIMLRRGLYEKQNEKARRVRLPGGGPWLIRPECRAHNHNTARAAYGKGSARARCICPRAVFLAATERAASRARAAERKANGTPAPVKTPAYITSVRMPDLSEGECATEAGREAIDTLLSKESNAGISEMRKICRRCPMEQECAAYALAAERPAGSWGGMWGGMTSGERIKEVRRASA